MAKGKKEYENKQLSKIMSEVNAGQRIIDVEGIGRVILRHPNAKEKQLADLEYSKAFTELLDTNLKTESEMEAIVKKRGIWTDRDENADESLRRELAEVMEKYIKAESEEDEKKYQIEMNALFAKMGELQSKKSAYMENTIEAKANGIKGMYTLYLVAKKEDGKPVWKSFDDMQDSEGEQYTSQIISEWMAFKMGLPSVFLGQLDKDGGEPEESGDPDGK